MAKHRSSKPEASLYFMEVKERMRAAIKNSGQSIHGFCKENGLHIQTLYALGMPCLLDIVLISEKTNTSLNYIMKGYNKINVEWMKGEAHK